MDTDAPAPTLAPAAYDRLRDTLAASGPAAAVERLTDELRAAGDYPNLFYALLMRKRVDLGLPPFPSGPAADLPADSHDAYEAAIRDAARAVGRLYLEKSDIPRAWTYFRLIGEPSPVKDALDTFTPGPDDDTYPIVDVAWGQGVHPRRGFDLILDRHGVCSAITMVGSADLSKDPALRDDCVGKLVRALHAQLSDRVRADLEARGLPAPAGATLPELLEGRDELFGEDAYHLDVSHLSSVVQMSLQLPPGEELSLARELCEYGRRLSPQFQGGGEVPFENGYTDYLVYLNVLAGTDVDTGLAYFRNKIEAELPEGNLFPAEVYVNLLVRVGREAEALAAARRYLPPETDGRLSCPGATDLARRVGDYRAVADVARAKGDPVTYLAGLIAGQALRPN